MSTITLADLPKIERGYLYVGDGSDSSVIAVPLFDTVRTITGELAFDSGVLTASESAPAYVLLDFGDASGTDLISGERFYNVHGNQYGYIYRISPEHDFANLRVRLNANSTGTANIIGRYGPTKPRNETYIGAGDGTITTEGTQAFSISTHGNIEIDETIENMSGGTYFWFYPDASHTKWNRRMRLDGAWTHEEMHEGLLQLGQGLNLDDNGNLTVDLQSLNFFQAGTLITVNGAWQDLLTGLANTDTVSIYAYRERAEAQTGNLIIQFDDIRTDGMAILNKGSQEIAVRRNGENLQVFASPAFDTGDYKARAIKV